MEIRLLHAPPLLDMSWIYESIVYHLMFSMYVSVLVSAGIKLIFLQVAAVFWIQYEKNVDNTDGFSCC